MDASMDVETVLRISFSNKKPEHAFSLLIV
jgi:hypothetical protein